ncbi:glycosyltransferase family 2 protein, partial [Deltaproteobacteria bacterium]|nr:glycosyltransferase family 2 protein [Deltaproteobacteria bacterium]
YIVVVDDCSPDDLADRVKAIDDSRIHLERHEINRGVGGAFITGCHRAAELGADILVKMDGDRQMDPGQLPNLIKPLLEGRADYTKGNRFWDLKALRAMPGLRIFGNMILSFLLKLASGYWNLFDPTNGYIALTSYFFNNINLNKIDSRYFFESSLLIQAGIQRFVVEDIPMPANYGTETSSLSILRSIITFPPRLIYGVLSRFFWHYILFDFTAVSVFIIVGLPALLWGIIFGAYVWIDNAIINQLPTPIGTIMLSVLPIIIGIQLISQAIVIDIGNTPKKIQTPPNKPI